MTRRIFKEDKLQRQFDEQSFCVVQLFSPAEIQELQRIYYDNKVEEQPALEYTAHNKDYALSKRVNDLIGSLTTKRLKDYLWDYRMLYSGFIAKIPGKSNEVWLHQDPTFVDESLFRALNVWCPLVDVDEHNGALWIIKRSDKFFDGFRGQPVKEYNYTDIGVEVMNRFGTLVRMKAGEVMLYDAALFHFSKQNTTSDTRIACYTLMVPEEATTIYHCLNKKLNTIDVYEIDNDFMLRYYNEYIYTGQIENKLLTRRPYTEPRKISMEEFESKYYRYNERTNTFFLVKSVQNIFKFFKRNAEVMS